MKRQVCAKRARKLRRRGESVWWDKETNTYIWDMKYKYSTKHTGTPSKLPIK